MIKNSYRKCFLHEIIKNMSKNQRPNVIYIGGDDVTYIKLKTLNLITSWKMIEMTSDFLQGPFFLQLTKR